MEPNYSLKHFFGANKRASLNEKFRDSAAKKSRRDLQKLDFFFAAALATKRGHELALLNVEFLVRHDLLLVRVASAKRLAVSFFLKRGPFEG